MSEVEAKVLDACCGSRMFWFDKGNSLTIFQDKREVNTTLCDGRQLIVKPDVLGDFTNMAWDDGQFKIVVLDPPHMNKGGDTGWQVLKYGRLPKEWREYITKMFKECFRVLENDGVLIFKWNETHIKVNDIIDCSKYKPMCGQVRNSNTAKTHWLWFMKNDIMKSNYGRTTTPGHRV